MIINKTSKNWLKVIAICLFNFVIASLLIYIMKWDKNEITITWCFLMFIWILMDIYELKDKLNSGDYESSKKIGDNGPAPKNKPLPPPAPPRKLYIKE